MNLNKEIIMTRTALYLSPDFPELTIEDIIYYIRNKGFYIIPLVDTYVLVCEYQTEWEDYYHDTYSNELENDCITEPIMVNAKNIHELRTRFVIYV
jgi:hypothetical protein